MLRSMLAMLLALFVAAAAPVATKPAANPDTAYDRAFAKITANEPIAALKILDPLLADTAPLTPVRGGYQFLRALALNLLGHFAEAETAGDDAAAALPATLVPTLTVRFEAAVELNWPQVAATTLIRLVDAQPGTPPDVRTAAVGKTLQGLRQLADQQLIDQLQLALLFANYRGDEPSDFAWVHLAAIRWLVAQGRADEAAARLNLVVDPDVLLQMLADRQFEPLWPALEAQAGADKLRGITGKLLAAAQAAHAAKPANIRSLKVAMNMLRRLDRATEAVAIGDKVAPTQAAVDAADEETMWVVDEHAYALADVGRFDDGAKRFAMLTGRPLRTFPGHVSFYINRARYLATIDRFEAALIAAAAAAAGPPGTTSPTGDAFTLQAQICALHGLGRDTAPSLEKLAAIRDVTPIYLYSLLCSERFDAAEAVVIQLLADPVKRGSMLVMLQPGAPPTEEHRRDKRVSARLATILARPAVRAAVDKVGRILPSSLLPS